MQRLQRAGVQAVSIALMVYLRCKLSLHEITKRTRADLSAHKVSGIREAIEAAGASLLYLPPYSPNYSPVENCWSKLKVSL
jgi:transposase